MANQKKKKISDNEVISEEIAQYYSQAEKATSEEIKKPFKFSFDIDDTLTEEIYDFHNEEPHEKLLFCSACVLAASVFLCTAFILGINTSSDRDQIDIFIEKLKTVDADYVNAKAENAVLTDEVNNLAHEALEAQERLATLDDYETTKQSLSKKLADKKTEFQTKNDELYNLNQELKNINEATLDISLTPGVYSIGTNLLEGTYDVTGDGSIIAATSMRETVINSALDKSTPVRLELKSGYTIKINCTAKFTFVSALQQR